MIPTSQPTKTKKEGRLPKTKSNQAKRRAIKKNNQLKKSSQLKRRSSHLRSRLRSQLLRNKPKSPLKKKLHKKKLKLPPKKSSPRKRSSLPKKNLPLLRRKPQQRRKYQSRRVVKRPQARTPAQPKRKQVESERFDHDGRVIIFKEAEDSLGDEESIG